ncbi:Fatty acyl-CoA reductase 1 [Sesamum alatum]|uniref:Fatty acyl-CoA reductase n=1 Tax=Sesamum alatum TaxID=300844 RepID=A0AAE1Y0W6_9LAMI|nr:Fatty acyl-CoA reductase 1 [Sesamum alatum]
MLRGRPPLREAVAWWGIGCDDLVVGVGRTIGGRFGVWWQRGGGSGYQCFGSNACPKLCSKLKMLLHVSTAYVHGMRAGVIPEVPFHMGQTLPGAKNPYLDINAEKEIVEQRLTKFHPERNHFCYEGFGHGKAMGEMIISEEMKGKDYKLIIVRPTIITSTYPAGLKVTLDALFAAYGKGKLTFFLADPQSILDMIPENMVVNVVLAAIARHSIDQSSPDFCDLSCWFIQ